MHQVAQRLGRREKTVFRLAWGRQLLGDQHQQPDATRRPYRAAQFTEHLQLVLRGTEHAQSPSGIERVIGYGQRRCVSPQGRETE